jgi:sarcosine oxidase subunit gamma
MAESALRQPPQVSAADWLKTLPPAARWVLHGDAQARARAAPVWGVGFSETACGSLRNTERATLWLGPDEYLLLDLAAREESSLATAAAIEEALRDTPHALVDVSHRQFALEVSGPHAEVILRGACPLDLHSSRFPVGMCTRTLLAKADITLWRTREDAFHLEVWRSFAGYVGGLLQEIAREFAPA